MKVSLSKKYPKRKYAHHSSNIQASHRGKQSRVTKCWLFVCLIVMAHVFPLVWLYLWKTDNEVYRALNNFVYNLLPVERVNTTFRLHFIASAKQLATSVVVLPDDTLSPFVYGYDESLIEKQIVQRIHSFVPLSPQSESKLPRNPHCKHQGKVFGIGLMKTGTTSLVRALQYLDYFCGDNSCRHTGLWEYVHDASMVWKSINDIYNVQVGEVIHFYPCTLFCICTFLSLRRVLSLHIFYSCTILLLRFILAHFVAVIAKKKKKKKGDSPWCFLFPVFDQWYPNSKYILTTRGSVNEIANSHIQYLRQSKKNYAINGLNDQEFAMLVARRYELHNQFVIDYFQQHNRSHDLLVINFGEEHPNVTGPASGDHLLNSYVFKDWQWKPLIDFLGCDMQKVEQIPFPRLNSVARTKHKGFKSKRMSYSPKRFPIPSNTSLDWKRFFGIDRSKWVVPYVFDSGHAGLKIKLVTTSQGFRELFTNST
ncbi:tetratricopeptide TPR_2 [Reticulomyxa filosa]|uniref:Tetratricopeptide TPR_2 n=1 Tax=Reticulomyxa filosa TaxID=46433 RepID=X6MJ19_RETFI|nr:tetratricopeptide TPR_2 [Reticulomyxa filosa]|eukprot:ETO13407.1 tetratricopeptide TPR_2 [Reticulomyxa filosa]